MRVVFCRPLLAFGVVLSFALGGCIRQSSSDTAVGEAAKSAPLETRVSARGAASDTANLQNSGFKLALPPFEFQFPRDHNAHPDFATEWWYYTGHLRSRDGRKFGYQLTWFRTALAPEINRKSNWAARDLMFAHFAISDENGRKFYFTDRIGRAGIAGNGATTTSNQPRVWCGDWTLQFDGTKGEKQKLDASGLSDAPDTRGQTFALQLSQQALKPPIIQGERGVSQKSAGAGRASHYYSYTRLQTSGTLILGDERFEVEGQSWFDHEFGSSQLAPDQVGWDWFSLQFEDGRELMIYQLRLKNGQPEPFSSGTVVQKDGTSRHIKLSEFSLESSSPWKSPQSGGAYPQKWQIAVESEDLKLEVAPVFAAQELVPQRSSPNLSYWEGSVRASGTWRGQKVRAVGYLEMTGYARAFGSTF